jgi:two-component system OmpR family sensor kinase
MTTAATAAVATTTTRTTIATTTTADPVAVTTSPSVRARITATVALLVLAGLVVAGVVVSTIESRRLDRQIASEVDQEFAELAKFQRGQTFASVEQMLRLFLRRNAPDDNELLLTWWDDGIGAQSLGDLPLPRDEFADMIRPLLADNGSTTFETPHGAQQVDVQTIRQGDETGALVVVTNLDRSREGLSETMRTYTITAALVLLMVTAMAAWVSGRLLSPLRTLRETADAVSESDLSQRLPATGNDDITALTLTFNGMLDRLEAAFVGQRQFLDDAGHELRTPLTVLRGHLELLDSNDPEDVAQTRLLLLDEIDRMARLVGDLILLAKSDRPDFLQLGDVDLDGLTRDLVAKARGLGDRDWTLDATARVKVRGDEQRLTQALLQLADNAVKHTHDGDPIAVGSSYDGRVARLWVRDTGPGVPPEDRARIFERFGRSAVPLGDEGFGLGLSIVGAIARAHGGSVSVEDTEAAGARFVITLPEEDPWPAS